MPTQLQDTVNLTQPIPPGCDAVLSTEALNFLIKLHHQFHERHLQLLEKRKERQKRLDQGEKFQFLKETENIRNDKSWQVAKTPADLEQRWVEITGPTDKKMLINALNSGADIYMCDFEDANSPTWNNMVEGQSNLIEAIKGTLSFTSPEGKSYRMKEKTAVLICRPRGLHLFEKHLHIHGEPIAGAFFDFGLYFFHNAKALLQKKSGPYFYLPKMESHLEARLWNDLFLFAEKELGIPQGSIRATVLIETLPAAFEMEEILYELKNYISGLNAGRWDYIFSIIKKLRNDKTLLFPDRIEITMTVPFMRAYTELLIKTCHTRGAHAMGGMAAFIPSRKDPAINEVALKKVRDDKLRESSDGFDGTWVAHPDLVPLAHEVFATALKNRANQKERKREEVKVSASDLLNFKIPNAEITEEGFRSNIGVALQYLNSWLLGVGAAAIFNLMEDVATAEISRSQLWQWIHHPNAKLKNGTPINPELYRRLSKEELDKLLKLGAYRFEEAKKILDHLVLSDQFIEFLTLDAYEKLK